MDLAFDLGDNQPAHQAQVVAGMFYDRRVFLVVRGDDDQPIVIAFAPHQAEAVGRDSAAHGATGAVHRSGARAVPVVVSARA